MNIIYNQDCIDGLSKLPSKSINCCVTSPPYYGLRDYGHEDQIGLEEIPEQYIQKLVEVFRAVKRVLKDDGTLWLNLGDSYNGSGKAGNNPEYQKIHTAFGKKEKKERFGKPTKIPNLKPKDLIGIPWMVAFALRADGWYLRQDIIWHKPNPMPESVTDRCTKAHEYIFLLSKSAKYYYDHEAIKEKCVNGDPTPPRGSNGTNTPNKGRRSTFGNRGGLLNGLHSGNEYTPLEYANKRSVWTVNTKPFKDAHFATFPQDLIAPCIKAGCPENGIVLDPFMGAGTTAVVARKLNRNYIGFELNKEYVGIANKRIAKTLGMFA
jgi:DNA modification methylase